MFLGSFIGMGFSILVMGVVHPFFGLILCLAGFVIGVASRGKPTSDIGFAVGTLGLCLLSLFFFNQFIQNFSFNVGQNSLESFLSFSFIVVLVTTFFFKTPIVFLMGLSGLHFFMGLNVSWFPFLFFFHFLFSLCEFYRNLVRGHRRLYFALWTMGTLQVLQLIFSLVLFCFIDKPLMFFFQTNQFVSSFQICILTYFIYFSISPLLIFPFMWVVMKCSRLKSDEEKRVSQKIIFHKYHSGEFSIHLSFFLLRQEFKNMSPLFTPF